jgi:ankyrin repeat protein
MPFTFAQADDLIQEIDALFASSESTKFAVLIDRLMKVNTLGVGKAAMTQVKERLIQLGQNSPHQAVLARLLLLIDIHLLEDVQKDGAALLQQALQQNDCNALKLLIDVYGADAEVELDSDGNNALHFAAREGYEDAVRFLIEECKMAVNKPNSEGHTALHWAAKGGNPKLVTYLLAQGADVTSRARNGETPLHRAAREGHTAICKQLIATGKVNVNAIDRNCCTALQIAAGIGELELVMYLITCGADVTAQNLRIGSPLHEAVHGRHKTVCEKLITVGKADVNADNERGLTALHFAAAGGDSELVTYLLACGADVTAEDEEGETPLHWAVSYGNIAVCKQLVATKRVDVNAENRDGMTALHITAEANRVELAAYLLVHGADIAAQSRYGLTPLHIAVERKNTRLVKLLLKAGARPTPYEVSVSVRGHGYTALKEAEQYSEIWRLLTDFSVIPERAALVRQETLRVLLPLSLHYLLIPPLQNIVAGYVELPEELPAEQKQLMPSTLFVQIELVEQALLAFAQEINNPSLGLTYAARIEHLNASAEKIIATLELPESCIHYWQQLQQQQKQIEADLIAVLAAETLLVKNPAACAHEMIPRP